MEEEKGDKFQPKEIDPRLLKAVDNLKSLQPSFEKVVSDWRGEAGEINRGCGLSAFILAQIVHKDNSYLPLDASADFEVDKSDGIHLIYGLRGENGKWLDHAWIEVVLGDQVLLISPESEVKTSKASFRATVFNRNRLEEIYGRIGYRRIPPVRDLTNVSFSKEALGQIQGVIEEVNQGEVPKIYSQWYEEILKTLQ